MNGKGDTRRPALVSQGEMASNWDRAFSKKKDKPQMVTVICTNDYPYEVVMDESLVDKRVTELQKHFDDKQGWSPSGVPIPTRKHNNLQSRIYVHKHQVEVYTGAKS